MFISREKFFYLSQNNTKDEFLRLTFYGMLLFLAPIFLGHQILVGIIVNALIISVALEHSLKKVALLCFLPSIAVVLTGFLFGGLTSYLLWVLPFIWGSNFLIAFLSKKLFLQKKKNYFVSTGIASIMKTIFLFVSVSVLFLFGLVPVAFLTLFGVFQLITAESGAIIIGFLKLRK